ncbi:MAG: NAD(P)-dependent oxidoreductase [Clostridia bacterium]|nr:NAD(P)-dependent oxidoreductase [Clostridia bacterium]
MSFTLTRFSWAEVECHQLEREKALAGWEEVNRGYLTYEEAKAEADRCLQCGTPYCQDGCPNHNPIRDFIALIQEGRVAEAAMLDWEANPLASCTGRVCAWEVQCEGYCVVRNEGDPIRIGVLERYMGDYALEHLDEIDLSDWVGEGAGERVAVVGAGPAGLAGAWFLARKGYDVTLFESWYLYGGVMSYGIPEYVLPQRIIDLEVEKILRLGVKIRTGVRVGRDVTIQDLMEREGFAAVLIASGANQAATPGVPGEDLPGVVTAKDFLMGNTEDLLGKEYGLPEKEPTTVGERVVIIGAGDTAMDAARTSLRLGAKKVTIAYRRTEREAPSRLCEVEHVKHEGGEFMYLVNPTRFLPGPDGRVAAVEFVRMQPGAPDARGRRSVQPIPGSEFQVPADTVILAVGYKPERDLAEATPGLEVANWGGIVVDREGRTSLPGVFAAGDCVTGAKTVIHAVHAARRASEALHRYLTERRIAQTASDEARLVLLTAAS